jgi:hypothetical protein
MLNEFASQWCDNLESGNFRQTQDCLSRVTGEDCCLGVGAKTCGFKPQFNRQMAVPTLEGHYDAAMGGLSFCHEMLGLRTSDGSFPLTQKTLKLLKSIKPGFMPHMKTATMIAISLVLLNDIYDFTFKQIAQVIRAEPEGLFV